MEALAFAVLLQVIDNTLRHEAPPPRAAPAIVRELLARPLEARDAAAIFDRLVPRPLVGAAARPSPVAQRTFQALLDEYLAEAGRAREELLVATGNAPIDEAALLLDVTQNGHPSADRLLQVAAATDLDGVAVANERFISSTVRFALALRSASGVPSQTTRIESAIGSIVIGSRGDDVHELAPATGGAISVIIDLGGNDTYKGSDVALRGFSAIIDFAGDDRYDMNGPGLGAAIAGAALLLDYAGNDVYRAKHLGQAAAGFGLGALIDLAGDDAYDLDAWGQGFGLPGGLALLWDAQGNDRYTARGPADAYDRGGGLSGAQGVGMGPRTLLAGGIGLLRDDAGDDVYEAEMFAQGAGYYYGIGVLWDRGGDDRFHAVRYAQGAGVHEAIGVLRDEAGNDRYSLKVGVGQGIGVDLAVGALVDRSGDDEYRSGSFSQGTATANGVGVLEDAGGADRFELTAGDSNWGHARWLRDLPSVGLFLYDPARASFRMAGAPIAGPPAPSRAAEPEGDGACSPSVRVEATEIERLRRDYFDAVYALGGRLVCALDDPASAEKLWPALEDELAREPATPLGGWIAAAYRRHAPPPPLDRSILRRLDAHPYCSVRAAALIAAPRADVARHALDSSCWRLQAAAVQALQKLGEPVPADAPLPPFLR